MFWSSFKRINNKRNFIHIIDLFEYIVQYNFSPFSFLVRMQCSNICGVCLILRFAHMLKLMLLQQSLVWHKNICLYIDWCIRLDVDFREDIVFWIHRPKNITSKKSYEWMLFFFLLHLQLILVYFCDEYSFFLLHTISIL